MSAEGARGRRLADRSPEEQRQIKTFLADALDLDQADLNAAIHRRVAEFYDDEVR